ncbi:DUF3971 domain-containing protein, partial [Pseudorhodobacter sp.]|uniref:YhdP family protein n=1 Tax=Pseudorhodobacter sp. TaxID=1934400 RepID=UPI002649BD82
EAATDPATADAVHPLPHAKPHRVPRRKRKHRRGRIWLIPSLIFLALGLTFAALALTGKQLRLPVWAVAEAEARLNTAINAAAGPEARGFAVSLGGGVVVVDDDWVPRLRLEDVRLLQPDGDTLLSLPETRVAFDPSALMQGQLRLRSVRVIGASMGLRRMPDGRWDMPLVLPVATRPTIGLSGLIASLVALFEQPAFSHLKLIEAQGLSLRIDDRMLNRKWLLGDGRLQLGNRDRELGVELSVSVMGDAGAAARAAVTLIAAKADASARMNFSFEHVAAADLAVQAAPLAWLGVLNAPISGQIASSLDASGTISALDATLTLGAGVLQPTPQTKPVAFDNASLFFSYDPKLEKLSLREWAVRSKNLALSASGQAYLPGVSRGLPQEVLAQIQINSLTLDQEGVLDAPVTFQQGAVDLRVRLNPFGIDIGQVSLTQDGVHLLASGQVEAEAKGWDVALNASVDHIAHDRLLSLWPESVVPKTRAWVAENVQEGQLSNIRAGFRFAPDAQPKFMLGYDYAGADVRFLKTLPPIRNGSGYAVIEGKTYTTVLEKGEVIADGGGAIDVSGTVFAVQDVTQKPAQARIDIKATGALTPVLTLLDQPPFAFLTKAKLPIRLGEGRVKASAVVHLPLHKDVKLPEVSYDVTGQISDFRSDVLVRGRRLEATSLAVKVTPEGMEISGKGRLQGVDFDGRFAKSFGPESKGISQVTGSADLSREAALKLGVSLPDGLISGQGRADLVLDMVAGQKPRLKLTSSLAGIGMAIPALGWSKPAGSKGQLDLTLTLGKPASVDRITLEAAGLRAEGKISLDADGGLARAQLSSVRLGGWLNVTAELQGRGKGNA